jgi:hypothetical protein
MAALCSHHDRLMRLVRAVSVFALGPIVGCVSRGTPEPARACSGPPIPSVPPQSEVRLGEIFDTTYARRDLARLVFRVRSAGPTDPGSRISFAAVILEDSLSTRQTPRGMIADSTGVALLDSVPERYTSVRVQRVGYRTYKFPLAVRAGYSDTVAVSLAETRVCLAH